MADGCTARIQDDGLGVVGQSLAHARKEAQFVQHVQQGHTGRKGVSVHDLDGDPKALRREPGRVHATGTHLGDDLPGKCPHQRRAQSPGTRDEIRVRHHRPGQRVRVRITFRVKDALWNNEADGLALSVKLPGTIKIEEGTFDHPLPKEAETREVRVLEFEAKVEGSKGEVEIPAYALYGVCEDKGGVCMYLRQDFKVKVVVDPKAPKIQ